MKKYKIFTRFEGVTLHDTIECNSIIIKDGAYLFLTKDWWDDSSYVNIIKSYPVMFTVVERLIEDN